MPHRALTETEHHHAECAQTGRLCIFGKKGIVCKVWAGAAGVN